ncbi:MAG TPA: undecaprenyl-diphosphate phosphatase [Candidatus Butyricicoccus avicola]|nr:undecaprenyl-diphosphate phosphatase [Candidatus Butyricicoccus avicola]
MIEILKTILFGIVEGITEWLPISSTGHMILLNEFVQLDVSQTFWEIFLVVIQLGAILAVVLVYWTDIFPFRVRGRWGIDGKKMNMWGKILVASIPAGVIGILFDDVFNALFYNYQTVSIMLILFGILFLIIENRNRYMVPRVRSIAAISYGTAFLIGVFQLIAAVFPGTSRSGATIVGALLLGVSRTTAAEFTFFLAIPAMFGGSAIKLLKTGLHFSASEFGLLVLGMAVAFVVSIFAIRFLMSYIKKHDFKVFGWYRIVLGVIVLIYFAVSSI